MELSSVSKGKIPSEIDRSFFTFSTFLLCIFDGYFDCFGEIRGKVSRAATSRRRESSGGQLEHGGRGLGRHWVGGGVRRPFPRLALVATAVPYRWPIDILSR